MFDIGVKDFFDRISCDGPFLGTYLRCPRCGYNSLTTTFDSVGGIIPAWTSPGDLKHHIDALERLKVFTVADLLNARSFELLRSSKVPLENLVAYVEAGPKLFGLGGGRARISFGHEDWPATAPPAISRGSAQRRLA